eukprot:CAMPEP_0171024300 /NCGR_PEP_ID=MMETSP0736-20130129/32809_1 /TAXON_ID=186038 /ORGANISM="Fragilariopsis kerguelensis, Strain L26-C5" /LENGTH=57 /DNA_ID=CAMNT_0011464027 /DNA_START=272 /DNA_END=445 /DNA_ORIENTATION=+
MSDNNKENNPFDSKVVSLGTIRRNKLGRRYKDSGIWSSPNKFINRLIGSPSSSGKKA